MEIDKNKCTKCGLCVKSCITKAVHIDDFTINGDECTRCFHCFAVCPVNAISHENRKTAAVDYGILSPMHFENLIFKRRSHRSFLDKEMPMELIEKIVDLIRYAPTGTNTQKVYITVLTTKAKVRAFSDRMMNFFITFTGILFNAFCYPIWFLILGGALANRLYGMKKFFSRYKDGEDILTYNAPALFIFHAPKTSSTPAADCSIWSTTGVLYAEALGLGTCYNGFIVAGLWLSKKLKKSLGIPAKHKVYSTFIAGYPELKFKKNVVREEAKVNYI